MQKKFLSLKQEFQETKIKNEVQHHNKNARPV